MDILSNVDSIGPFAPELVLSAGVLVILVVDLVQRGSNRKVAAGLTVASVLAAGVALAVTGGGDPVGLFGGMVARDPFADFWKWLFLATTLVVGIMAMRSKEAIDYTEKDPDAGEFYALALATCVGMFVMASSTNMLVAYLSLEMVSILGFVLAGFKRHSRASSEAALKYTIYGGVASGCMLYGLSLLYGLSGTLDLASIQGSALVTAAPGTLVVAVGLTMAGFGYKIAVVPFHQWCPDVYQGAPTPVTAFLSVGPKAAGFALLARFLFTALPREVIQAGALLGSKPWPILLGAIAVATMTYGNVVALVQTNVKRMLAYSSIAHAGYTLLGLLVVGLDGRAAVMFYLAVYLFMNLGAFGVINALVEAGRGEDFRAFHRLGYRAPALAALMAVFMLSLTGLPPTAGFAGKFLLFSAMLKEGGTLLYTVALIGVINSAVSLFYYAKVLRAMYFGIEGAPKPAHDDEADDDPEVAIDRQHLITLWVLAVPLLVLGIFWSPLLDWARDSLSMWGAR